MLVGMGTRIVEVVRVRQLIDRHAEVFLDRVFTPREQEFCRERVRTPEHFAALWAAKEATLRSLGTTWNRTLAWTDLEIDCTTPHEQRVILHGAVAALARIKGAARFIVASDHCRAQATATVLALRG